MYKGLLLRFIKWLNDEPADKFDNTTDEQIVDAFLYANEDLRGKE